ncbi:MAG TPA: NUDIX hydrolase [Vicinamibacterales bacterium]|nr:NUDIX hydrolase [Vicinamibacterales bacterium]
MREYPERPIVGVGAVVVDGERVLLVRRGNEPLKGEWSLPGGAVEAGETLEVATAREIREETGLEIEVGPMVEVLDRIRLDPDGRVLYHYVLIDFLCRPTGGMLCCGTDAADVTWAAAIDLRRYGLADTTLSVIHKAIERARAGPWTPRELRLGHL